MLSGERAKRKVREKRGGGGGGQFPPVLFSCSCFLNPRGSDYLGAWNRLLVLDLPSKQSVTYYSHVVFLQCCPVSV